jgi:hypothetical protein
MLVLLALTLLVTGLLTKPAFAEDQTSYVVGRYINSKINPKPKPKWDTRIAPQLARAEEQRRVQEDEARRAASAAEAQRQAEQAQQPSTSAYIAPTAMYSAPVSTNDAKMFIYMHESGNNPGAINASSGACGLGQSLPCSKMGCSLSDYTCQDQWFTSYMLGRYGSWENARAFWLSHSWW